MGIQLPKKMHKRVGEAFDIWGIESLYPPQEDALEPIASGENLVAAVPTAAGKSLIAYIAILNQVLRGKKALYVVPLRALAAEKYQEMRELSKLGIKVALSYGDFDEDDRYLERYDIVIATSEKADSLLRHRTKWLNDIKVIVSDEVHLLNDPKRGPTLEVILTRFKQLNPDSQMICLSATVRNAEEIAGWLGARLITSDFRPVNLRTGILQGNEVTYSDMKSGEIMTDTGDPVFDAALDVIFNSYDSGGQILVFANTRRSAESLASNFSKILYRKLNNDERGELFRLMESMGKGETRIHKRIRGAVKGGAAFHHAGLSNEHRGIIENAFKERKIKALFATPTLAAGINLPARRVLVRDWTRFESFNPRNPIPVMEIKQMMGRAGRPKYDREGESFILARSQDEVDLLLDRYLWGTPEEVLSKLGSMPALRMHLLSSFATNYVRDMEEMWEFIRQTFYAYQNDTWKIEGDVEEMLQFLSDEGFITIEGDNVEATDLGKRVARLYIDPLSAVTLKTALHSDKTAVTPFSILHAISSTTDINPLFMRGKDRDWVLETLYTRENELLLPIPEDHVEYDWFLGTVKTALFFSEWIGENADSSEAGDDRMESLFNMGPGDIRTKVEIANWMLYSMRELSRLFNSDMAGLIDEVALRVEHGIRKELIPLVSLKGIGRVRARSLFEKGFNSPDVIRRASISDLSSVPGIGRTLAVAIKGSMDPGGELEEDETEEESVQSNLLDFA
ncbi:MAG: DEAD/DEAH box helicase [Thermoplasmatota archaeon]